MLPLKAFYTEDQKCTVHTLTSILRWENRLYSSSSCLKSARLNLALEFHHLSSTSMHGLLPLLLMSSPSHTPPEGLCHGIEPEDKENIIMCHYMNGGEYVCTCMFSPEIHCDNIS